MTTYSTAENFLQPVLQYIGSKGFWFRRRHIYRLVEDYSFEWGDGFSRKRLWMKAGFEFDKASKPRSAAVLGITTDGETDAASMMHDRLYRDKGRFTPGEFEFLTQVRGGWEADSSAWSRAEADDLYQFMAVCAGYPKPAAWVEKWAVKLYPPNWFKGF